MERNIIVIPTYNEVENIEPLIKNLFSLYPGIQVLVVDDHSPDKTYERVCHLMNGKYANHLHLIVQIKKEGLAKAYIRGFSWCLERNFDIMIQMDSDFSHDPKYIRTFLDEIERYDVVVGSRYVKDGHIVGWSYFRKFLSYGGNWYARCWLDTKIYDLTSGFRCFRRSALEKIINGEISSVGYAFQIETLYKAKLWNHTIKEIPILFKERQKGKSKLSQRIFLEALLTIPLLRFQKNNSSEIQDHN